jgi:L-ascorbate metabolism protein UlaG (beta-lactamase superfamily)
VIKTSKGDLTITFIGHASLMMSFGGKNIYVDPIKQMADYSKESNGLTENSKIWEKWMIRHARDF